MLPRCFVNIKGDRNTTPYCSAFTEANHHSEADGYPKTDRCTNG